MLIANDFRCHCILLGIEYENEKAELEFVTQKMASKGYEISILDSDRVTQDADGNSYVIKAGNTAIKWKGHTTQDQLQAQRDYNEFVSEFQQHSTPTHGFRI